MSRQEALRKLLDGIAEVTWPRCVVQAQCLPRVRKPAALCRTNAANGLAGLQPMPAVLRLNRQPTPAGSVEHVTGFRGLQLSAQDGAGGCPPAGQRAPYSQTECQSFQVRRNCPTSFGWHTGQA